MEMARDGGKRKTDREIEIEMAVWKEIDEEEEIGTEVIIQSEWRWHFSPPRQ